MPSFSYKAVKSGGERVSGTVSANSEADAVGELRRQGLVVVSIAQGGAGGKRGGGGDKKNSFFSMQIGGASGGSRGRRKRVRIKTMDMVVFTRQLSTMISSGIPLVEAIEILASQTQNVGFRNTLDAIGNDVRQGKDLSQALSQHPKVFPKIYINMIRAGEASGQLDIVLTRLAEYQESAAALKSEIRSAMTYPVVSLVLVLGITIFLLVFIIPKFEEMFHSMDVELPGITKGLLATSLFLQKHFVVAMLVLAGLCTGVVMYLQSERGALVRDWMFLKIPIFGPLFQKVAISRFSRTFATLIQSGVPILGALEIVSETCGNQIVANAVIKASENVRQGETLGEPLAESGVFPPMVTKMVSIGEKTGALESLLEKIADFYDQQIKTTVESLTSLIEPLMIGIMGFLVGGMVMAIFLPVFKMVGTLSGK